MSSPVLPDDLDTLIARCLSEGYSPSRESQERFAPSLCYGRHFGFAPHNARPAAVMLALYKKAGEWYLPVTRRPANMKDHAGQICLPGGAIDGDESVSAAAARELEEELGVPSSEPRILGQMAGLNLFVSNFWVTPIIATLPGEPRFQPNPSEVADVIEAPVSALINAANWASKERRLGPADYRGWHYSAPYIAIGEQRIWGATAVILGGLIDIVTSANPQRADRGS